MLYNISETFGASEITPAREIKNENIKIKNDERKLKIIFGNFEFRISNFVLSFYWERKSTVFPEIFGSTELGDEKSSSTKGFPAPD